MYSISWLQFMYCRGFIFKLTYLKKKTKENEHFFTYLSIDVSMINLYVYIMVSMST